MNPSWAVVVVVLLGGVRSVPEDDASTAECLRHVERTRCEESACGESAGFTRACLDTAVPFRTPYARVRCCLRCCLLHWVRAYGLDANWRAFKERGPAQGAVEAKAVGRIDEVLFGHNHAGTLSFAARRATIAQANWWRTIDKAEAGAAILLGCGPYAKRPCTSEEEREAARTIWTANRTGAHEGWREGWIEVHLGDSCGGYHDGQPFGGRRYVTLSTLARAFLPKRDAVLVTSTDCNLPGRSYAFLDVYKKRKQASFEATPNAARLFEETSVLDRVVSWFTTNPSDFQMPPHPKLRAVPIGVKDRARWVVMLDGREASGNRTRLVACCCMSSLPTPLARSRELTPQKKYASFYDNLSPHLRAVFDNASFALDAATSLDFTAAHKGYVGEYFSRVRRSHVLAALQAAGLSDCGEAERRLVGDEAYADLLFQSDFVVSPRGKGRACHRDWEALAAGAVPILDYDTSSAMAALYDGLPVVRVRDWRDVTPAFLHAQRRRIRRQVRRGQIDMKKLYVPYWIGQFTSHLAPPPPPPPRGEG